MSLIKPSTFTLILIACTATSLWGADKSSTGKRPEVVVKEGQTAVSDWPIKLKHQFGIILWTATHFTREDAALTSRSPWWLSRYRPTTDSKHADTRLTLSLVDTTGHVQGKVLQSQGQTRIERGVDRAFVSAIVNGTGKASFRLAVEMPQKDLPAGTYGTEVVMLMTAP